MLKYAGGLNLIPTLGQRTVLNLKDQNVDLETCQGCKKLSVNMYQAIKIFSSEVTGFQALLIIKP